MNPLETRLRAQISSAGPLSFADFMESALYDIEHGYYGSGRAQIGKSGDFYTSVSVGPLFGRLLAREFIEMWELLERPPVWTLVEQGAYNGQLACDVLEALESMAPECFKATQLWILEPFPKFKQQQALTLSRHTQRVHWAKDPSDLPQFTGVHYSNELLDAFPVARLQRGNTGWHELRVGISSDHLEWTRCPILDAELLRASQLLPEVAEGFCMETRTSLQPWLREVFAKMDRGWVLALDYGMSSEELGAPHRKDGTIAAYKNHKRIDTPLGTPGEIDLTAHVDFTNLATLALAEGWDLVGYTDQHRFFTGLAPLHFKDASEALSLAEQKERLAFRSLTHPQLMGAQFKVFCLSKNLPAGSNLAGFQFSRPARSSLGLPPI